VQGSSSLTPTELVDETEPPPTPVCISLQSTDEPAAEPEQQKDDEKKTQDESKPDETPPNAGKMQDERKLSEPEAKPDDNNMQDEKPADEPDAKRRNLVRRSSAEHRRRQRRATRQ
jgi:hypothetical protein